MAVNRRCERFAEKLEYVVSRITPGDFFAHCDIFVRYCQIGFFAQLRDIIGYQDRSEIW